MKKQVGLRFSDKTLERITEISDALGIDRGAVVELAVAFLHRLFYQALWGSGEFEAEAEALTERVRLEETEDAIHLDFGDRGILIPK